MTFLMNPQATANAESCHVLINCPNVICVGQCPSASTCGIN